MAIHIRQCRDGKLEEFFERNRRIIGFGPAHLVNVAFVAPVPRGIDDNGGVSRSRRDEVDDRWYLRYFFSVLFAAFFSEIFFLLAIDFRERRFAGLKAFELFRIVFLQLLGIGDVRAAAHGLV